MFKLRRCRTLNVNVLHVHNCFVRSVRVTEPTVTVDERTVQLSDLSEYVVLFIGQRRNIVEPKSLTTLCENVMRLFTFATEGDYEGVDHFILL
jgi:hypothetical protein